MGGTARGKLAHAECHVHVYMAISKADVDDLNKTVKLADGTEIPAKNQLITYSLYQEVRDCEYRGDDNKYKKF